MVDHKCDYRLKVMKYLCLRFIQPLFMLYFNLPSFKGIYIREQQAEIGGEGNVFTLPQGAGAEFVLTLNRRGRIYFPWSGRGWIFFSDPWSERRQDFVHPWSGGIRLFFRHL